MTTRICIDPGVRAIAVSMSEDSRIVKAGMVTGKFPEGCTDVVVMGDILYRALVMDFGTADELHIERPVFQAHSAQNPEDIINLALVVGCFTTVGQTVKSYRPTDWKGSLPKKIHHKRIGAHVNQHGDFNERMIWTKNQRAKDHNVRDAFALNLFALGRVKRGAES